MYYTWTVPFGNHENTMKTFSLKVNPAKEMTQKVVTILRANPIPITAQPKPVMR